jgi:acyl-CoA synthetase (AMP-forming)/AMP-acid ligase II
MTGSTGSPPSLTDYLWHWEATSPDRSFASDDAGGRYTYAEAAERVRTLSAELVLRGVGAGDRIAVLAENSTEWIVAFLAAMVGGSIAVPLATRLTADELDDLLRDAGPVVIMVDAALLPTLSDQWRDRVLLLTNPLLPVDSAVVECSDGSAPSCLTYTSGTTNRPKGVLLSNAALTRASEIYAAMFHSTPSMHTIVAVPLCHNTGFVDQLGHALVAGGSIDAHRRFRADRIAEALQNGECNFFIGVPTMYHRILDQLADEPPSDRAPWLAFGGAPMPSQLIARLHHHFPKARLANCYGLSEATSITHINFVTGESTASDVGVAVAGTVDCISASGELLVRSPTSMLGYHGDQAATAAKFEDGWLRTGDLASRDANGMLHVYGRVDDVINRGGEKVVPLEVEEVLCSHPAIVEAAVVGLPDDEYGSIVVAAVVTNDPGGRLALDEYVEGSLADYKRPVQIVEVDHLPRNQNGKVIMTEVRALILQLLAKPEVSS